MKNTGIALIFTGLLLTLITAFTFFTREKIVDIGSLKITASKPYHISWSPLVGIAVIGAGGLVFFLSSNKTRV